MLHGTLALLVSGLLSCTHRVNLEGDPRFEYTVEGPNLSDA
jgi:hypothetical protein